MKNKFYTKPVKYKETTNSIKYRDGSFIIVVVKYDKESKIYTALKDIRTSKYIPKNKRWYIPEMEWKKIILLKKQFNFFITTEAKDVIWKNYEYSLQYKNS